MYQHDTTRDDVYLALCGHLAGILCNLAGEYRAAPSDVMYALMMSCSRALANDDARKEIAGRIRGLLQEQNEKEGRRQRWQIKYAAQATTKTLPMLDARLDLNRAVNKLSPKEQELVIRGEVEGLTDQELATEKEKEKDTIKKARQRATERLRDELEKK
jgi:DNA-directed RNA polymerase specialized sigma24 family protein